MNSGVTIRCDPISPWAKWWSRKSQVKVESQDLRPSTFDLRPSTFDFGPLTKEWQGPVVLRHVSASILFCDGRFRDGWTGRPRLSGRGWWYCATRHLPSFFCDGRFTICWSEQPLMKLVAGTGIEPVVKDV